MTTYFTKDHEYIRMKGDVGIVGITDYAQSQLGDVVYIELPEVPLTLTKGAEAAVVESVKAASEVCAPVSGEVIQVNDEVVEKPGLVNEDPAGEGWFMKMRLSNPDELNELMNETSYAEYLGSLS